jgi:spheroidene monooxygenase
MGLGEIPLVRQCTFSLWKDKSAMRDYAFQGAHQAAITAAYRNDFFSESLFVHLQVLGMSGKWMGNDFGDDLSLNQTASGVQELSPAQEISHV